jgi:hypothetical protein
MPRCHHFCMTCSVLSRLRSSPEAHGYSLKSRCSPIFPRMTPGKAIDSTNLWNTILPIHRRVEAALCRRFHRGRKAEDRQFPEKSRRNAGFHVEKTWGETIEDRGSQVTYSALGQQAPLEEKEKWDADFAKRKKIKTILDTLIPEFSVRLGGATSIDVTKPGIDKAYGIKKLQETLGISVKEMIYVGDALFVGGNDYPAEQAGVISIPVRGPNETKRVIEAIIACLDDGQQARAFEVASATL